MLADPVSDRFRNLSLIGMQVHRMGFFGGGQGLKPVLLLIQQGLLTDEQLKLALDEQKRTGRKLGRELGASAEGKGDGFRTLNLRFSHWKPAASGI
ncbi:MAG: hypothetical protein B7X58_11725, partial [Marinobacter sp. 34-60-7]